MGITPLALAIALTAATPKAAPDVSPTELAEMARQADLDGTTFARFAAACEAQRKPALRWLSTMIAATHADPTLSKNDRQNRLRRLKEDKAGIESRNRVAYPDLESLETKKIGAIPGGTLKILQIIDGTTARVRFSIDGETRDVIARNFGTEGLADGESVLDINCWRVAGNKTYLTVLGSQRTVMVPEPFNTAPVAKFLKATYDKKRKPVHKTTVAKRTAAKPAGSETERTAERPR